jgi:hypothetical protein
MAQPGQQPAAYDEAALQRLLTEDAGLAEQGIEVTRREGAVVLTGCVETEERRVQVAERVAQCLPGDEVRNDIVVVPVQPPTEPEAIT